MLIEEKGLTTTIHSAVKKENLTLLIYLLDKKPEEVNACRNVQSLTFMDLRHFHWPQKKEIL